VGTPMDLGRLVTIRQPVVRARYELQEVGQPDLAQVITEFLERPTPTWTRDGKGMAMEQGEPG